MNINLRKVIEMYTKYKEIHEKLQNLENQRELVSAQLKQLIKSAASNTECDEIKEKGKQLRSELKELKETLYPIEDEFVHEFLNLPNLLHNKKEELIYCHEVKNSKNCNWESEEKLCEFVDDNRYYLLGDAAHFDLRSIQTIQQYFVHNGSYLPLANPDFVRCVLLEGNGTPLNNYHMVLENNLQNKINSAYLTGGGAFESFLGAVTKLSVYPSVFPLRWISCGRIYQKVEAEKNSLYSVTQTNAAQLFVATETSDQADEEMKNALNLATNFYKELNIPFRVVYTNASELSLAECQRASIEVYSPLLKRYIVLGYISNYSNFVSKRILFNVRDKNEYNFPHILGGPILQSSRLIAALNEYEIPLKMCEISVDSSDKNVKAIN